MTNRIDELKGRVKEAAGKVTDDKGLEAKGKSQAEGARAGRKIKGAAREAGGVLKEAAGKITGDERTEVEGKAGRLRGKAERTG
jgi:uncharacterized protein YjbJ (UPF0337 family)